MYGQKQAGRVWNKYLIDCFVNRAGFKQSNMDDCVFYKGNVIYVLYTDDSILAGPNHDEINQCIEDIKRAKLDIAVEGDIKDFLERIKTHQQHHQGYSSDTVTCQVLIAALIIDQLLECSTTWMLVCVVILRMPLINVHDLQQIQRKSMERLFDG